MPSDQTQTTDRPRGMGLPAAKAGSSEAHLAWHRTSAIAAYPGFNSYLEVSGERMRFVIDAKIERAAEVRKLQQYIKCMAGVLALARPRAAHCDELQFPDEGI